MATINLSTFAPILTATSTKRSRELNFWNKLKTAVHTVPNGTIIDCTNYTSTYEADSTLLITRPLTILFGACTINFTGAVNTDLIQITSPGVKIIGNDRGSEGSTEALTKFVMPSLGRSYHISLPTAPIWPLAASERAGKYRSCDNLVLKNLELVGLSSEILDDGGVPVYETTGSGGVWIAKRAAFNFDKTIDNMLLENIRVKGARAHGIVIFGASNSKVVNCSVTGASGHGVYLEEGNSNDLTNISVDSCTLAGIVLNRLSDTQVEASRVDTCGLGYWINSSSGCTVKSSSAKNLVKRDRQPVNLSLTLVNTKTITYLQDIGLEYVDLFDGTSFMSSGLANYGHKPGDLTRLPYGWTSVSGYLMKKLVMGTGDTRLYAADGLLVPDGFTVSGHAVLADYTSGEWSVVGAKPGGANVYLGPGGIEFHTGWDEGEEYSIATGWGDAEDYIIYGEPWLSINHRIGRGIGWVWYGDQLVRQIITGDLNTGADSCSIDLDCPIGFICDGGNCVPDLVGAADSWLLIGYKPVINTPVYEGPQKIQFHTGWDDGEQLVQKLYGEFTDPLTEYRSQNNCFISCVSQDPGNRQNLVTYSAATTAHFKLLGKVINNRIISPKMIGEAVKYKVVLSELAGEVPLTCSIDLASSNISLSEDADFDYLNIADVLNVGHGTNIAIL